MSKIVSTNSLKSLKTYIRNHKAMWVLLGQGASVIILTVKGFVSPPNNFNTLTNPSETKNLAFFIVVILVGIFFYVGNKWSHQQHTKGWTIATILLLVLLIVGVQSYTEAKSKCTCIYGGETMLIGQEYTELGREIAAKHIGSNQCQEVMMEVGGRMSSIWTSDSINSCRRKLDLLYFAAFSAAALTMLSVLQIIKCYIVSIPKQTKKTK